MFCAVAGVANGFTTTTLQNHHRSEITTTSLNAEVESSRRAFMANAMTAATVMTIGVLPKPAFADDLGDLSMPSADEQAAQVRLSFKTLRTSSWIFVCLVCSGFFCTEAPPFYSTLSQRRTGIPFHTVFFAIPILRRRGDGFAMLAEFDSNFVL